MHYDEAFGESPIREHIRSMSFQRNETRFSIHCFQVIQFPLQSARKYPTPQLPVSNS